MSDRDLGELPRGGGRQLPLGLAVVVSGLTWLAQRPRRGEGGFTVAESLAMAAVGVVIIVALWAAMKAVGIDVIDGIRDSIVGGGSSTPTTTPTPP